MNVAFASSVKNGHAVVMATRNGRINMMIVKMATRTIATCMRYLRKKFLMLIMVTRGSRVDTNRRCGTLLAADRNNMRLALRLPLIMLGPIMSLTRADVMINVDKFCFTREFMIGAVRRQMKKDRYCIRAGLKALAQRGKIISETASRIGQRICVVTIAIESSRMFPVIRIMALMDRFTVRNRMIIEPIRALAPASERAVRTRMLIKIMM